MALKHLKPRLVGPVVQEIAMKEKEKENIFDFLILKLHYSWEANTPNAIQDHL